MRTRKSGPAIENPTIRFDERNLEMNGLNWIYQRMHVIIYITKKSIVTCLLLFDHLLARFLISPHEPIRFY